MQSACSRGQRRFSGNSAWEARRHLSEHTMRASFCENETDICGGSDRGARVRKWRCAVDVPRWSRSIGHGCTHKSPDISAPTTGSPHTRFHRRTRPPRPHDPANARLSAIRGRCTLRLESFWGALRERTWGGVAWLSRSCCARSCPSERRYLRDLRSFGALVPGYFRKKRNAVHLNDILTNRIFKGDYHQTCPEHTHGVTKLVSLLRVGHASCTYRVWSSCTVGTP